MITLQEKNTEIENWRFTMQEFEMQIRSNQEQLRIKDNESSDLRKALEQEQRNSYNLQIQIKELNSQITIYTKELDNWKQRSIKMFYNSINSYQTKENDRIKQIEEIKSIYENQIKNEFTSVVKGADQQRQQMETEIVRLRQQLDGRLRELEQFRQQIHMLEQQLIEANTKASNYENKLVILTQEIETNNFALQNKNNQQDQFKRRLQEQETEFKNQFEQQRRKILQLEQQLEDRERKLYQLSQQNEQQRVLETQVVSFEEKMAMLSSEIERLHGIIRQKDREFDQLQQNFWRTQNHVMELENVSQVRGQMEERIQQLQEENERLRNERRSQFDQQLDELRRKIRSLEQEKQQSEIRMNNIKMENERLIQMNQHLTMELEQYQQGYNDFDMQHKSLEQKIVILSQEIERLTSLIKNKNQENENLRRQLMDMEKNRDYEQKVVLLTSEIERLNLLNLSYSEQIDMLKQKNLKLEQALQEYMHLNDKNQILNNEIDRLQHIIDELVHELEIYKLKYADVSAFQQKLEEQLMLIALYRSEIESLRYSLTEKERELSDLRRSSIAPYKKT